MTSLPTHCPEYCQSCILSPCLFNLYAEYIIRNAGLEEAQAGIKTARRNINNLRYANDTTLMAESEEELKSLLKKVKEESEKVGLKLNIQKTKIMASSPITSWQIDGETVDTVAGFIFLGSKITADVDCSHEIKRHLLLGRKVMTNLDSILKSTDITLPTNVRLVKAMVFPVAMYGCDSWTIKKAERQRIDGFFFLEIIYIIYLFIYLVLPGNCYQLISLHPRAHMLSHVIPWTSARQTPLSMDFSRQEYWSGLPFLSPELMVLNCGVGEDS